MRRRGNVAGAIKNSWSSSVNGHEFEAGRTLLSCQAVAARTCAPVLSEIAFALRDESLAIDTVAIDPLATFLKGPDSTPCELNVVAAIDETADLAPFAPTRDDGVGSRSRVRIA
jgi:hypothetical protein